MKYSLRSLMIVVTLVAVLLGGRVEYLRRWAVFHEREAERYAELVLGQQDVPRESLELLISLARGDDRDSTELPDVITIIINGREFYCRRDHLISLNEHRQQAAAYRLALHWRDE
ncbi:MAG: hypothetical protein IAF94_06215 [Pirellulaceae bacterium]|nr:hypothetical protein [Pirellulaceae bacterium]